MYGYLLCLAFLLAHQVYLTSAQVSCTRKNVCKNLEDYWNIQENPNCWYNLDVDYSVTQIIVRYGFVFETYKVTTQDGYILTLFRVPHNGTLIAGRPPVLLHHGLGGDGSAWFNLGIDSIVFQLSNSGYDVWIANARGTTYSSEHIKYSIRSREYWDFSFHERAIYDLPAMIDFIAIQTGQRGRITYIGHSSGTTISYIYASIKRDHAIANIKSIISLAPMAYMSSSFSLLRTITPYFNSIWTAFSFMGIHGIGSNIQNEIDSIHSYCSQVPSIFFCSNIYSWIAGYSQTEVYAEAYPIAFSKFFSGLSFKEIAHFTQLIRSSKKFQFYDYGEAINYQKYGCAIPPEYNLAQIQVPVSLYYGKKDALAVEEDVVYLYNRLTITQKTILESFSFDHYNFVAAKDSKLFYSVVLGQLK